MASVALALIVLRRGRADGRDHGRGLAITALVIDGIWAIVLIALFGFGLADRFDDPGPDRGNDGQVDEATDSAAKNLRVGDCVNDPSLMESRTEPTEVETVEIVPCTQAHDLEVYEVFSLPGNGFPGSDNVRVLADQGCLESFPDFVGTAYQDSTLAYATYYPRQREWEAYHDREVTCLVADPERRTVGTLAGTGR